MDSLLKTARENWISALFAAGYGLLDLENLIMRAALGLGKAEWEYFQEAWMGYGQAEQDIQVGMGKTLTVRLEDGTTFDIHAEEMDEFYSKVSQSHHDLWKSLRGFTSETLIDTADLAQYEILMEYGDNPGSPLSPDGVGALNFVNIRHALESASRNITSN